LNNEFEQNENDIFMGTNTASMNFKKLRTKFITKIILIVIISLILFSFIVSICIPLLFNIILAHRNEVAERAFVDAVMFTIPAARIESFTSNQEIMNLKLSCKYSQNPYLTSNQIHLTIPTIFGKVNISGDGYSSRIFFNEHAANFNEKRLKWDKLQKISDISVCQAIIYFSSPISIDELDDFITGINANNKYTWVAIDTGNIELLPKISSNWSWGFPLRMQTVNKAEAGVTDDSLLTASEKFQTEMQFLEKESRYLGKKYTLEEIKSVNNYISDNGIKVKGVVILARTKDLLKYKDNKLISDINVIHAELDFTPDY